MNQLFQQQVTSKSLVDLLSEASENNIRLYGGLLILGHPIDQLVKRAQKSDYGLSGIAIHGDGPYLIHTRTSRRVETAVAYLWKDAASSVSYFVTNEPKAAAIALLRKLYWTFVPFASVPNFRTPVFFQALAGIAQDHPTVGIRIREYTAKSSIADPSARRSIETVRGWTDTNPAEVFESLSENRQWLNSLRLEFRGDFHASGRIWREGLFSCDGGFRFWHSALLRRMAHELIEKFKILKSRDSVSSPTGHVRPLRLTFQHQVFARKEAQHKLANVLKDYPKSSVNVVHPNPYFHASVIDYVDGSSVSVWVTEQNNVLLVPKKKSSSHALQRLSDYIFDRFEDGELAELGS
jgi:hypothetical protein